MSGNNRDSFFKVIFIFLGDLHQHILRAHGIEMYLQARDSLEVEPNTTQKGCQALLHSTGHWFYPKCERDDR